MANVKFLASTIKDLTKEQFDHFVATFQKERFGFDSVVNVDGANDGGCDLKVFRGVKQQRKCIQLTVNKSTVEAKLRDDLHKLDRLMEAYPEQYPRKVEFYCTTTIAEKKLAEYVRIASKQYGIDLDIYDCNHLATLIDEGGECEQYLYSLHPGVILNRKEESIDKTKKCLYDFLAEGKNTSDIKNNLLESLIVSVLYIKAPIGQNEIKKNLESIIEKDLPDITYLINRLKSQKRIKVIRQNLQDFVELSENELKNVQDTFVQSSKIENDFKEGFNRILMNYQIDPNECIIESFIQAYKSDYVAKTTTPGSSEGFSKVKEFFTNVLKCTTGENLIEEVIALCESSPYLAQISAGEAFLYLYKSNELEQYLNKRSRDVYFDTPVFIYWLCSTYGIECDDWNNPLYRAVKSLYSLLQKYRDRVNIYISREYLSEVLGEMQKALLLSPLEKYEFFENLGGTNNILYTYYKHIKTNNLFEARRQDYSFEDFLNALSIEDTIRSLTDIANGHDIQVVSVRTDSRIFSELRKTYETELSYARKAKTSKAITNDINQILYLCDKEDVSREYYLATWDTTVYKIRDRLMELDENEVSYRYCHVYNPARLSNIIALENFNISNSALTIDIFSYADARHEFSSQVKSLLELIAPFLQGSKNTRLLNKLGRFRREQIEFRGEDPDKIEEEVGGSIYGIISMLLPKSDDKEMCHKFLSFCNSDDNVDYIMRLIKFMSKMEDYTKFDLSEYREKLELEQIN